MQYTILAQFSGDVFTWFWRGEQVFFIFCITKSRIFIQVFVIIAAIWPVLVKSGAAAAIKFIHKS